jgi:hypothetical protein
MMMEEKLGLTMHLVVRGGPRWEWDKARTQVVELKVKIDKFLVENMLD